VNDLSRDPATVCFRSIAEILLRSIRRCVATDYELDGDSEQFSNTEKPVLDNLANSLPEPLDFASDKPLSVSNVSQKLGFGAREIFRTEVNCKHGARESHRRTACALYHTGLGPTLGEPPGRRTRIRVILTTRTFCQRAQEGVLIGTYFLIAATECGEQDRCPTTFSTCNSAFLLALSVLQTGDRKLLLNIA
jgi:hypothetical protein